MDFVRDTTDGELPSDYVKFDFSPTTWPTGGYIDLAMRKFDFDESTGKSVILCHECN
jgi:hypothetical protein